jgi:DNA-binding winged helix-turn-helix (wHTH) protein
VAIQATPRVRWRRGPEKPFRSVLSVWSRAKDSFTKDGEPVPLSARALDILIALLSQPNEALSEAGPDGAVWPDVNVERQPPLSRRELRKALGDGKDGALAS